MTMRAADLKVGDVYCGGLKRASRVVRQGRRVLVEYDCLVVNPTLYGEPQWYQPTLRPVDKFDIMSLVDR